MAEHDAQTLAVPTEAGEIGPNGGPTEEEATYSKWNLLSLVSFILTLLTIPLILSHVSGYLVLGIFGVAVVLGIIGLIQVKNRGQRGRGFALASLLGIGLFFVVTLIAFASWE